MKAKLLLALFASLFSLSVYADPPTATIAADVTICPGNRATLTITGTPNSVVFMSIVGNSMPPLITALNIPSSGTTVFQTPILDKTTTYSLDQIRNFTTQETTNLTGVTATVSVIPNGCASIATNSTGNNTFINCNPGECRTLSATLAEVPSTASYTISSIPYCPQAAFTDPSYSIVNAAGDDIWSSTIPLPFNFSFFDQIYSSCQVGTNGIITFNPQVFPGFCEYDTNDLPLPSLVFPHRNAIFGPFQDTETRTGTGQAPPEVSVNFKLMGTYPCRKLVVNFYHLGQHQCNQEAGLQTSQIVLYEVSNIIEVYIQNRTQCDSWQNGDGVIGIVNAAGTVAHVPSGRNIGDNWTATNEAWRFTPSGPNVSSSIRWINNATGNTIAVTPTVEVCPNETSSYIAEATYDINGVPFIVYSEENLIIVAQDQTQAPTDLLVCFDPTENYSVDLTQNHAYILGALNPADYEIEYFTSLSNAELWLNPIVNPTSFSFTQNQIIYAAIMNVNYDCIYVKSFEVIIGAQLNAPSGVSPQYLNPGQTLADVVISGDNIQWYDAPQGGNQLPITTVLQNNTSYYATQSVGSCESRSPQSFRLEVIVQLTLGTDDFARNAFSLYPNPTSDILTLNSNIADVKLEIFNILSQKVGDKTLENGANTINLNNLASGVYMFRLSLDGKTRTYRVVKN